MQGQQQHSDFLDKTLESESEMDIFEVHQLYKSDIFASEDKTQIALERQPWLEIRLTKTTKSVTKTLDEIRLGEIETSYMTHEPSVLEDHSFFISEDKDKSLTPGITVLTVKGMTTKVVTAKDDQSVMSFYTKNKQQYRSTLKLTSYPCGIAKVKDNQIAVAGRDPNQIVFFKATPDLVCLSTVNTNKAYRDVAVLSSNTLVACSIKDSCVDVIDMKGKLLQSVTTQLAYPSNVCVTRSGNILVSDSASASGSLYCMTPSGDVVFTYRGTEERSLISPVGITTTRTGDILVADYHAEKVIQLTASGEFVRDVFTSDDYVVYPLDLCLDDHNMLYVVLEMGAVNVYSFK